MVRLAWFNVDEEERQSKEQGSRAIYLGLPVTTTALILPIITGLIYWVTPFPAGKILPWVLLFIAVAFITPFKIRKPGLIGKIIMLLLGIGSLVTVLLGVPMV